MPATEHGATGWIRRRAGDSHEGPSLWRGEGGVTGARGPGDTGVTQWHLHAEGSCPAKQLGLGDAQEGAAPRCQGMGISSKGVRVAFAAQLGLGTRCGVPSRLGWGVTGGCMGLLVPAFGGGARAGVALRMGGPICKDASWAAPPLRGLANPTAWLVAAEGGGS